MDATLNIAIRAAREAGKFIAQSADRIRHADVIEKGPHNFVTFVDTTAEQLILDTISQTFPSHSFLTEETGVIQKENKDAVWIIDPLDGTTNFIHGLPNYVVSIAFQFRGVLEYGVIYHPLTQDLFCAARGQGTQLNNQRIRVSNQHTFSGALVSMALPRPAEYIPTYLQFCQHLHGQVAGIRRSGATALDLAYVAAGKLDLFWNVDSQPWDIAAGSLLIKEAGGLTLDPFGKEQYLQEGHLMASNIKLLKIGLKTLHPYLPHAPHASA